MRVTFIPLVVLALTLAACGGGNASGDSSAADGSSSNVDASSDVLPAPGLELSVSPARLIVVQGKSVPLSVTIVRTGGPAGEVALTVSGLPSGVTAAGPPIPAEGTSGTITLSAEASAAQGGPYSFTVVAAGTKVQDTAEASLLVGGPAGSADVSFSFDGMLTTDFGRAENATAVAVRPNGQILAVGSTGTYGTSNGDVALARYQTDGTLDETFGTNHNGKVITDLGANDDTATAMALDSEGRIVLTANAGGRAVVLRYTADGNLDPSFNTNGKVLALFGSTYSQANGVALQPDGKLVVVGLVDTETAGSYSAAIARLNADGTKDTSFGADHNGVVAIDLGTIADQLNAVALQKNGMIVAVGQTFSGAVQKLAALRLDSTGKLDATFATAGKLSLAVPGGSSGADGASTLAIDAEQRILVGGHSSSKLLLLRLDSSGALDATFGTGGVATADVGVSGWALGLALQADGRIVAAGRYGTYPNFDVVVLRMSALGVLDAEFNSSGMVKPSVSGHGSVNGVALDEYGRIVVAGYAGDPNQTSDMLLLRLWP